MEKRQSEKAINEEITRNLKGLSPSQQETFKQRSDTGWFKSYARVSNEQLRKISKKVRQGIAHGKYTYESNKQGEEKDRFVPPKKEKKKKGEVLPSDIGKRKTKKGKIVMRSYTPKTIKRVIAASKKYLDSSNYEQRHGVNSVASQKYRLRHNQSKNYTGRIVVKEKK